MQQTKRRSKKGVILLALAVALLVVAIVPAAAMAAPNILKAELAPLGTPGQGGHNWVFDTPQTGSFTAVYDPGTGVFAAPPTADFTHLFAWRLDGGAGMTVPAVNNAATAQLWSGDLDDGLHDIAFWAETTVTPLPQEPKQHLVFGVDDINPVWSIVQDPAEPASGWYGKVSVKFTATASDPGGSGVVPTPTADWTNLATTTASHADGVPLAFDQWTWVVTGTVTPPNTFADGSSTIVNFAAMDVVGNAGLDSVTKFFDVTAPATTYEISPAGADTNAGWTNKDVTLTFDAIDPYDQSGVDYTEFIVKESSTTATPATPGMDESGTKGDTVTITETGPVGPVYVFYRSVDKAVPANKEDWHLVMVFIDKNAPMLSDDAPSFWVNEGIENFRNDDGFDEAGLVLPRLDPIFSEAFPVDLMASDPNSGLAPGEIMARVPGWHPPVDWTPTDGQVWFWVDEFNHATDGLYALDYKVSDMAGNEAQASTEVKIDTRAPVTDGASGWINGTVPYVLTATDQAVGAGVSATAFRVDQATPWSVNVATTPDTQLMTSLPAWAQVQGAVHTIDFSSFDASLPFDFDPEFDTPAWHFGNFEGSGFTLLGNFIQTITGYKTRSVMLDVTAPTVTAVDPKNGAWQKGPAIINFSGTDVGSGFAFAEWSTDGGATWNQGNRAEIGGNGVITVTFHGVDNVGIKSADQTIVVMVASTPPTVAAKNATVKKGHKATFKFNVTCVTPKAQVIVQIRTKGGVTLSTHHYANVSTNAWKSVAFKVNLKKGKYNIRIGAVDQAGNTQTKRGVGTLTVK